MTSPHRLAMIPRDGLFCKDGRGWFTSALGRGHGLDWPFPSTLLGALRTAYGRVIEAKRDRPLSADEWLEHTGGIGLGATLALRRPLGRDFSRADRLWPVPADALFVEGEEQVLRLEPQPVTVPTLSRDDDRARERLWRPTVETCFKPRTPPRWWGDADFSAWLVGNRVVDVANGGQGAVRMQSRLQAHVGIVADTQTAGEGILFTHDVFETLGADRCEWGIGCEVELPAGGATPLPPVTLGADRRPAQLEELAPEVFEASAVVMDAFRAPGGSRGLRLVAVTPIVWERGWLPDRLASEDGNYRGRLEPIGVEVELRAAFVPRPQSVSGWDMARKRPKPVTRLVPPGAVYFFERADGNTFTADDAEKLWLSAIGCRVGEGFGRVVPGVWRGEEDARR
ncbi:MAG: CRISPR-associated protein Crm3 [Rhodospirillales bacterium]|nr:CRISPR-associated protein Crm3 [Rhodospirillales bacterium]